MKSNYKKLGEYIRSINNRNKELISEDLQGLSMSKEFRKSTSNIIGTDLKNYKLVYKHQFACDFMSIIRVHKFPVVLHVEIEPIIVSPAYTVFEVIDEEVLNPQYLMMWLRRTEYDRYADFRCDSAIRGGFKWEELCESEIPIPSIEKQREIVKEYHSITDRIKLNEQLNQKLEDTVQSIYTEWFVNFEFPDENGKPYKSSGGEMVFCDELDREIPKGWELLPLSDYCDINFSKRIFLSEYTTEGVPFYRSKEIILKKQGKSISNELYISRERYSEIISRFGAISKGDILLSAVGTIGVSYMVQEEEFYFKDGNLFWFRNFKDDSINSYLYEWMQNEEFKKAIDEITFGSTQKVITTTALYEVKVLLPSKKIREKFSNLSSTIRNNINMNNHLTFCLEELQETLLSKMATIEG
ncbi:restriction endonuclease subunit S [Arcobacter roscoffensis]|uniref:Restriction endonuclease subunit S n=1 Tax=Arcobacter roscoffensis TaxID=2961520 RepID=A0ABY5E4M2_9BACT|nr:restriction endonuclease subunit S [Arcobacter roscoffensis]UTJ07109.1 restriction endonuclease subunit S [Arcobacter roscoffensis]